MIAGLTLLALQAAPGIAAEARHYTVDYLVPPDGALLEVGGLAFLPDGRLAASTRRGQVWLISDPLAEDPRAARFSLFAEGLQEGLGLEVVDGEIYVVQRGELSRLRDVDGDGLCDDVETLCDAWGLSGNYHEFAYGLPVDRQGRFHVSLNVSFFNPKWWHGKSTVPWRGWVLRIAPDGTMEPLACGFRSPCGLGWSALDELLVTDNQGDWMPASPLFVVREGGFYGHPASLDWTPEFQAGRTLASDTVPPERASSDREPAAIWLPYEWSRSPGNVVCDRTGGRFGPFGGELFIAELTNGMILRGDLETVNGVRQGWVVPFRRAVGSSVRLRFAPDGTLFAGFTNRGWGGLSPADGIGRLRYTGVVPFEIERVALLADGFRITLTRPLAADLTPEPADVRVRQYDYDYWWEYGSPERDRVDLPVRAVELDAARRVLVVRAEGLVPAKVARVTLNGLRSVEDEPLLHGEFAYTVNQLPGHGPTREHVARIVPPPPARTSGEEGWLRLTYGDATDLWRADGWELCDVELDPDDPTRFVTRAGVGALTNTAAPDPGDDTSKLLLGDGLTTFSFFLPQGGDAEVLLQGRYGIRLADSGGGGSAAREPDLATCGALLPGPGFPGRAPDGDAYGGPGRWHALELDFRAPRLDASGRVTRPARLVRATLDAVTLHEDVELHPSAGALGPETALGPLVFRARTPFALGNVRHRPARAEGGEEDAGWVELLDEEAGLEGWLTSGEALWSFDDGVLVGEGPRGHLFSPRGDYRDFDLRARLKISDGGNSGVYLRAAFGEGWPAGYEAQVNSSFADPQKTGSLYGLAPVKTHLIAPDTWFDYDLSCRDEPEGTRLTIRVNGVLVVDYLDTERRHAAGHVALQQHHEGSVIEVRRLAIREL